MALQSPDHYQNLSMDEIERDEEQLPFCSTWLMKGKLNEW